MLVSATIFLLILSVFSLPAKVAKGPLGLPTGWTICSTVFTPASITITPFPPKRGQDIEVVAKGNFPIELGEGSKVFITGSFFGLELFSTFVDVCEATREKGRTCPLLKGDNTVEFKKRIPNLNLPGVSFNLKVSIKDGNGNTFVCVQGDSTIDS